MITWAGNCTELPRHLTITQGLLLHWWDCQERLRASHRVIALLRKAGITTVEDGQRISQTYANWRRKMAQEGIFLEEEDARRLDTIEEWVKSRVLVGKRLHEAPGLFGIGIYMAQTWKERNDLRFQVQRARMPTGILLKQILSEVDAFPQPTSSDKIMQALATAKMRVQGWIDTWVHCRHRLRQTGVGEEVSHSLDSRYSDLHGIDTGNSPFLATLQVGTAHPGEQRPTLSASTSEDRTEDTPSSD
ncbi:hypothetical protein R1sor_019815 [Riccia sorocarpa]|uniref:Uncharacterized protein n=1 Tax=Riccia sorocarpa TaxID=122646 RepID=A0ABD3IDQ0_9MARC